ncbi:hypothetical protein LINPERHAP1_LOCUS41049 [Linum perenne]
METYVEGLTIEDDDGEELIFGDIPDAPKDEDYRLCLVGFLVTDKSYNFPAFQTRMASLWRPGRGVTIEDIGNKLILIRFYHAVDLKRVLEMGPWSFNQSLLVLKELQEGETPVGVEMTKADF